MKGKMARILTLKWQELINGSVKFTPGQMNIVYIKAANKQQIEAIDHVAKSYNLKHINNDVESDRYNYMPSKKRRALMEEQDI